MTEYDLGGRGVITQDSAVVPGEACLWLRAVLFQARDAALRRAVTEGGRVPNVVLDAIAAVDTAASRWKASHARNPSVRGRSAVLDLGPAATLTTAAAAALLGISPRGVTDLIERGRLEATWVGGRWQVDERSVEIRRTTKGER